MDAKVFMEALDEIEATKGISKQSVLEALKEALRKALEKNLFGGAYEGSDIRVEISEDPAQITMKYVRKVVEEVQAYSASSLPTTIDLNDSSASTIRSYYSSLSDLSTSERQGTNLLKNLKTIFNTVFIHY